MSFKIHCYFYYLKNKLFKELYNNRIKYDNLDKKLIEFHLINNYCLNKLENYNKVFISAKYYKLIRKNIIPIERINIDLFKKYIINFNFGYNFKYYIFKNNIEFYKNNISKEFYICLDEHTIEEIKDMLNLDFNIKIHNYSIKIFLKKYKYEEYKDILEKICNLYYNS